jgi:energy-coupling factor transporter ATP-binding protein EcfA2
MTLNIKINKIKSIKELSVSLPITKGLYAIAGQNGSGKSTVVTCASTVFFNIPMKDYFGDTDDDASIFFELDGATKGWSKINGEWKRDSSIGNMNIKGFYEGSVIFGNRFRNTDFNLIKSLDNIGNENLGIASDFVRTNLGYILHNKENFYEKLYQVDKGKVGEQYQFAGVLFYYEKRGRRVSQFHMSTGENLLISVLNSIDRRNKDRTSLDKPCILFLDEIELALHPSSLKRLVFFLKKMSDEYNYAIYFSTHSIELISGIRPENIFFLERDQNDSIEILNPCYPAYATRILYDHSGFDYIILVEDDLAKSIVTKIIIQNRLLSNKLVHVLPCGGYSNVIELAQEVTTSNLVGRISKIIIILDGDVEQQANSYISNKGISNNIPLNFLPIESLEKFLRSILFDHVDKALFRHLNDYIFHVLSLSAIIEDYTNSGKSNDDRNGKKLYSLIDTELRNRNKSREDFIEILIQYLIDKNATGIQRVTKFLKDQLKAT